MQLASVLSLIHMNFCTPATASIICHMFTIDIPASHVHIFSHLLIGWFPLSLRIKFYDNPSYCNGSYDSIGIIILYVYRSVPKYLSNLVPLR